MQSALYGMVSMIKTRKERDVLAILKTLISTCIDEARHLTLRQLKQYPTRNQIENDNYLQITKGIIERNECKCPELGTAFGSRRSFLYSTYVCGFRVI